MTHRHDAHSTAATDAPRTRRRLGRLARAVALLLGTAAALPAGAAGEAEKPVR